MKKLSPAAQAVLDAGYALPLKNGQPSLAAALEAAADQVVPAEEAMPLNLAHRVRWDALQSVRYEFLAIANELKAD